MANTTIAIKKSATVSSVPSSLEFGELAINYADGKLYYKNVNSSIVEFAPTTGGGNSFGTVNANSTLVISDSAGDILTFIAGNNISIVGDAVNDRITFSANLSPAFDKANTAETIAIAAFAQANTGGGGSSVETSDTAPVSPADGDLWWNSTLGKLFVYYDDGSSAQWVEASPVSVTSNNTNNTTSSSVGFEQTFLLMGA